MQNKLHVKKGDTVEILSGKDKGKKGKVLSVIPEDMKIIVEGVNIATRHVKPRGKNQQGGIMHQEAPIHSSKAMIVCDKCGRATRVGRQVGENNLKVRICKKCGEEIKQ